MPIYSGSVSHPDRQDRSAVEAGQPPAVPAGGTAPPEGPVLPGSEAAAEPERGGTERPDDIWASAGGWELDGATAEPPTADPPVEAPADAAPAPATPDTEDAADAAPSVDGRADDDTQVLRRAAGPGPLARAGAGFARTGQRLLGRVGPAGGSPATGSAAAGRSANRRTATTASPQDVAGSALARLTTLPVLLVIAWLLPGLPLLLAGEFVPIPMLLISAPLFVALVANGLRVVPASWPRLIPGRGRDRGWEAWFGLMATVAVAAGFAAWQLVEHSESVVVLRGQGAYLQTGYWLAQHGALPIPQSLHAFGGARAGLSFASLGFFAHGTSVVPSFTSGLPMLLAGGFWAQGVPGAAAIGPVLGGLAVLSFGGLAGRLAGPQWAPAGAVVLGLALPEQYASRSSLAETVVQVLLFGGLCLLIDSLTLRTKPLAARWRPADGWRSWLSAGRWADWLTPERTMAGLAGLALSLGVLASLDSLAYLIAVIPVAGLLVAARRPGAIPFCIGVVIGTGYGLVDGYVLSRPFLDSVSDSMKIIGILACWLTALTIVAVQLLRGPRTRAWVRRTAAKWAAPWLPAAGGLLVVAALIGFAVRPYIETVHGTPSLAVYHFIASLQRLQGLPLDPTRTYAEDSLYWVIWYVGLPTLLLGGFGVALLMRQCLRALLTWKDPSGSWRNWALPLAIICAASVGVLWQPNIVPDQPWASRRLLITVLPGLILGALWAAAWLTGHARERGARRVTASVAGVFCVMALVVPTAATTFGAGFLHTGRSGGLRPSAQGMAFKRTGAGELTAVEQLCASIRRNSSVVIIDRTIAEQFTQVIRGMCDVPVASMTGQTTAAVSAVIQGIQGAGRHPVLLGSRPGQLTAFGGSPVRVLDLVTAQDAHDLTSPPTAPSKVHFEIWMLAPQSAAVGA
jgi:hypothetical protein